MNYLWKMTDGRTDNNVYRPVLIIALGVSICVVAVCAISKDASIAGAE